MDKLIKLLSEYTHIDFVKYEDGCFKEKYMGEEGRRDSDTEVINKEYGFIKRLVDNDKINTRAQVIKDVETWGSEIKDVVCYDGYESLLMLLSISDKPIEDLISYLK